MERPKIPMTLPDDHCRNLVPGIMLFFWLFLIPLETAFAWELARDKNGIKVYTHSIDGSSFKAYRGVMEVSASLASLIALVDDISACPDWIHTCKEGRLLQRMSSEETYTYTVNQAPWPVQDRDAVVRNTRVRDPDNQSVTITITGVPDYIPREKGLVRVKMIQGFWRFIPVENNRVQVLYQVHNDPGGNLPSWLVNSVVVSQPYRTLLNMKEMLTLPKYRDAK
jgi:ribosome-associated toxin RatA of RatAB toxin-antitoxin module